MGIVTQPLCNHLKRTDERGAYRRGGHLTLKTHGEGQLTERSFMTILNPYGCMCTLVNQHA
ncbi:MAG: hypothetical protein GY737_00035 [Desulfobacteraceae bacterium]|nr:hypothetical protein [Desulfobacteraceae bacterium]